MREKKRSAVQTSAVQTSAIKGQPYEAFYFFLPQILSASQLIKLKAPLQAVSILASQERKKSTPYQAGLAEVELS